jgi:hypothetical protein
LVPKSEADLGLGSRLLAGKQGTPSCEAEYILDQNVKPLQFIVPEKQFSSSVKLMIFGALLGSAGLAILLLLLFSGENFGAILVCGLLPAAIGGLLVYKQMANAQAEWSLGEIKMLVHPTEEANRLDARVIIKPRRKLTAENMRLEVEAVENAREGSGSKATNYTHEIWSGAADEGTVYLGANIPNETLLQLDIPPHLPESFSGGSNQIIWSGDLVISLSKSQSWRGKMALTAQR